MSERICFVIAPIGVEDSETRRRSDQILKHVVRPIAEECNYKALRADEIAEPGLITNHVIQHIINDQLVLADLTERNPNVFYELAIRHAIRKPLIQIIEKGESLPFDVAGMRTIQIDYRDLDSVADTKTEIIRQIRAIEANPDGFTTPIEVAMFFEKMKDSQQPDEQISRILLSLSNEIVERLHKFEDFLQNSHYRQEHFIDSYDKLNNELHTIIRDAITETTSDLFAQRLHEGIQNAFSSLMSEPDALQREVAITLDRQLKIVMERFQDELGNILQSASLRIDNRIEKMVRDISKQLTRGT